MGLRDADNVKRYIGQGGWARDAFATAVPTGRIPFVATEDIARAAVKAITEEGFVDKDIIVLGPELLTYDQVCLVSCSDPSRRLPNAFFHSSRRASAKASEGPSRTKPSLLTSSGRSRAGRRNGL